MNADQLRKIKSLSNYHLSNMDRELMGLRYLLESTDREVKEVLHKDIDLIHYHLNKVKGKIEYLEEPEEEQKEEKENV